MSECPGCGAPALFSKVDGVGWYIHDDKCPYRVPGPRDHIRELERQAEEDRAAIRAYKKAHDFVSLHPPCECVICLGHAPAIARAERREGQS